jgi:hypothetical protein
MTIAPREVRVSALLWFIAVGAGAFETLLVVVEKLSQQSGLGTDIIVGVAVRLAVFGLATCLILQMRGGRNWARLSLTVLLGILGSASLLITPIAWFAAGHSIGDYFAGAQTMSLLFAASRVMHIGAVFGGLLFMFQPDANSFFRSAR